MFFIKKLKIFGITNIIIILILNTNCNIINKQNNKINIKQGCYLHKKNIQKIQIGMNKSEILINIGSPPELKSLFGSNTWYYIYYDCYSNKQRKYQTIILTFDSNDILTKINIHSNITNNS